MEALFNPGDQEISYRISRSTAVLIGKTRSESKIIFEDVRNLYKKRSNLVHTGKADIKEEDIIKLRHYVRESIKALSTKSVGKDDALRELNTLGFGDKF